MQASSVTDLLFKQLNFRGEQQKVISTNIANIDTVGFKTKELEFKDELKNKQMELELKLNVTHSGHMKMEEIKSNKNYKITETPGLIEQNDGNNINLDTQMSSMAQNSMMFSAIQSSIKKDSSWFKSIIDASSKKLTRV